MQQNVEDIIPACSTLLRPARTRADKQKASRPGNDIP